MKEKILDYVRTHPGNDSVDAASHFQRSTMASDVMKYLSDLVEEGLITRNPTYGFGYGYFIVE